MGYVIGKKRMSPKEYETFFRDNFYSASLIAYRYIEDDAVVKDIVQEAFIIVWEKNPEIYRDYKSLKHYLFITVRNRTISYLRSVKEKYVNLELFSELKSEDEEKLYPEEELALHISKAITHLPPKCKEIFILAYVNGLTYIEIAEEMSISKNTVKTQMGIAYRILRKELKEVYFNFFILMMQTIRR